LCLDLASCLGTQTELLFFGALAVGSALSGLSKIGAHEPGDALTPYNHFLALHLLPDFVQDISNLPTFRRLRRACGDKNR
jgi:hypothetical protein